jgi:hypothetical protein
MLEGEGIASRAGISVSEQRPFRVECVSRKYKGGKLRAKRERKYKGYWAQELAEKQSEAQLPGA